MKIPLPKKPKPATIARWVIWAGVVIAIFWAATIVDKPIKHQKALGTIHELKTKINRGWLLQTAQATTINEIAQALTRARNLKPGDALPPSEIFTAILRKNPETSGINHLNSTKPIHLKSWQSITNGQLETPTESILDTLATVPAEGEPYAVTAIFANPDLIQNGMQIYPNLSSAKKRIQETIEITGGLGIPPKEKVAQPAKPNP